MLLPSRPEYKYPQDLLTESLLELNSLQTLLKLFFDYTKQRRHHFFTMKFSSILLPTAVIGSAMAQSVQLPELADGSYLLTTDADGKQVWTEFNVNVTDSAAPPVAKREGAGPSSRINKRFNWPSGTYPWCPGGDWFLFSDFYDHAWDAFYSTCWNAGSHKYPAGSILVEYQGNSVAYMCAYTANPCSVDEWADAVNWVANNCAGRSSGWMEPGYLNVPGWNKRYGYAKSGARIC
ncbi:uncharacterized protein CTRU02_209582 [Colletotrichum truncatum]|uniref:Uncharacterized protein n=1 Tax=Colletotrichum truncatum TaxID=5467 RepID=A0ACC3YSZ1_COLTU|nr:uncharacterized protein CTRU02_14508 [Colletotrichum truncatum]KAF6782178.1 hypothetical protein CTRU02_14508 [Colletotrichum truncatum]